MQDSRSLRAETTLVQTMQRLIENKKVQIILALVLVLLAIRLYFPAAPTTPDAQLVDAGENAKTGQSVSTIAAIQQYQASLEKQLGIVLSEIKGAGKVTVMLTLASTNDILAATNLVETTRTSEEKDSTGTSKVTVEESHSSQPVIARISGGDTIVKLKEILPEVSGVVVIATGANDARLQATLSQAVQTILSLPAHRVRVFPGN